MRNVRYLGERRIGGIIVAFTGPEQRDSYGNYWTQDTDFALQRYDVRPLYYQHRGDMVEAGHIQKRDLVLRSDGLYMECDLLENEAGEACLNLVKAGRGHYSTGVMPGSWREASDGWVELWPLVECSVTDRPATKFGLTRANLIVRSLGMEDEMFGDGVLRRGPVWLMEADNGAGSGSSVVVESPAAGPQVDVAEIARQVASALRDEMPTRQVVAAPLPAPLRGAELVAAPSPGVQVNHAYDQMSLVGLAAWGSLRWRAGKLTGDQRTELIRALQRKIEKQRLVDDAISEVELARGAVRMIDSRVISDWGRHIRANESMGASYANYGDELVPTLLNSVLYYFFMVETQVLSSLMTFQMPSDPFDWPVVTSGATIRKVAKANDQADFAVTASIYPTSKMGTNKVTFTAGKVGAMVLAERELFEDSAVSVAEMWSHQLIRDMASAIDYVLLNGDETASIANISHYGTDPTSTAYDKILVVDGLRHMAFGASQSVATATIATTSSTALRKKMGTRGKFGLNPRKLVHIVDPGVYYKLLDLSAIESIADVGPQATLLTGQVGQLKGVPVVVADELEATNASGQIEDSHDSTLGSHLMVNRDMIRVGWRREIEMEMFRMPGVDGHVVDISARFDVQELEAGAVAYGYNATV